MIKLSAPIYSVEVSDEEKAQATQTRESFKKLVDRLEQVFDKLKIVREVLDQFQDSTQFGRIGELFVRYKHRITDLFNEFQNHLQISLELLNKTLSDSEMENIKSTILAEAKEIRDGIEDLLSLLDSPESGEFIKEFTETCDRLQNRANSLEEIITDHLFDHIDYDILGRIKLGKFRVSLSSGK